MNAKTLIYCIEDDLDIQNLVLYTLRMNNFDAAGFTNYKDFFKSLESSKPVLILLDLMLPHIDGLTILKQLKANNEYKNIPVIICSAKGTEYNKVNLLNEGADDYLVKPFGMMELVARINAVLRRTSFNKNNTLKNGNIIVDLDRHIVFVDNKEVILTLKEYELLLFFMENIDKVISRDTLIDKVWGAEFIGESRTIDVHVGTLRSKIDRDNDIILTIRGVGYRMVNLNEKENI